MMIKEKVISLIDGFTIELSPKVRHKLKSIPLDKKNNIFIIKLAMKSFKHQSP